MKNSTKKIAAVLSAAILGALPMANSFSANAAESNNEFVKFVYGDVCGENGNKNPDGKITIEDAQTVLIWAEEGVRGVSANLKKRADVNGDGNISKSDAKKIQAFYVEETLCENRVLGDATGNGDIDISDAVLIARYAAGEDVEINLLCADVNRDGKVSESDNKVLQRYLARFYSNFDIRWGDVDGNGTVAIADKVKLNRFLAGTASLSAAQRRRADVNFDGKVNRADSDALSNRIAYGYFVDC